MCPAIHINSRSWLRSSSTHEPSDPPHRVVKIGVFWSRLSVPRPGCLGGRRDGEQVFLHATGVEKTNGFEKRAICCGERASECPLWYRRAVCSRRPPPRPGLATGDFGVDAPSARGGAFGETPARRAEFENRADGTLQVGSPSLPSTLSVRRSGLLGEDRRAVREGGYLFARSREGTRASHAAVQSNVRQ
jgi:hypothetical protein